MGRTVFCKGRGIDVNTTSRSYPCGGVTFAFERAANDAVASFVLVLQNVVVGSAYRVDVLSTGAEQASGTAASSAVSITLPVYPSGHASNSLRIKIRKGSSAPKYKPFETQATAVRGSLSVWVQQEADPIA